MRVEQLTDPIAYHAEGPVWSARWGGLRWVDMLAGDVLSLRDDGSVERRHVGKVAAVVRPRLSGGAVIATERGFLLEEPDSDLRPLPDVWTDPGMRMNEGGCDPDGRFYCGSMGYDRTPGVASLYRLDPDHSVHRVLDGITISNGLDWTPDGSRAYYVDTMTHRIDLFDYDREHGLHNRRPFVDMSAEGLFPDGLTVDVEGGVWVALANGGAVRRYTAEGRLDEVIEVPARKVTACTFGGPRLDQLFITTSREDLEPGEDPLAGSLFYVEVGPIGVPTREFYG
ncbi:MAG TPA: SMP-30/gluconolactonase/LRE family protein [Longimicrobiaceae bacterium]